MKTQNAEPAPMSAIKGLVSNNSSQIRTGRFAEALVSPMGVSTDDVVLDISPSATRYIEGAVNIDYEDFLGEGGQFKPVWETAKLLGEAGISSNDSLVIAGECLPCGGGPSPAIFTYWLLKYLGHEKVRVLEGSIDDWAAAGLNTSNESATRPKTDYVPQLKPELLATYDFVVNSGAQIVDARPARDFGIGSIPGAVSIPYENVMVNESIKPQEDLQKVFAKLEKGRPVIVYTNVGVEASLVWFCSESLRLRRQAILLAGLAGKSAQVQLRANRCGHKTQPRKVRLDYDNNGNFSGVAGQCRELISQ